MSWLTWVSGTFAYAACVDSSSTAAAGASSTAARSVLRIMASPSGLGIDADRMRMLPRTVVGRTLSVTLHGCWATCESRVGRGLPPHGGTTGVRQSDPHVHHD